MPKLLNFPWLRRLLGRGVNTDISPEFIPDGFAREAVNVRPTSIGGESGAVSAIGGEVVASFEQQQPVNGYVCIGSASCNEHFVEFYIGATKIVKIDGVVVAESDNIPYLADRPLQIAVVNDVRRGVLYPADDNSEPLYWDVQDLLDNVGTPLYFADYTTDTNSVLLTTNPEFPVHVGNVEVSPGLPVGEYQYALRYVSPLGDRSAIGPWTPLITVPLWQDRKLTWQQQTMPGLSTVGGPVSPTTATGYGVKIQFRIDNQQGYSAVEILRRKLNDGTGKSIVEVVDRYGIAPGQVSVETFVDPENAVAEPEVVPDDESGQQLFTFTKPKAVEYQDRRIIYGNFETESRDSGITFMEVDGNKMVPITQAVFTQPDDDPNSIYNDGYSDPVNNTYMKTYVRGEKYGFGVMVWDKFSNRYYVTELADEYQFPNRRDPKLGDSLNGSDNPIWAANTNCNGEDPSIPLVTSTFDAFTQGVKSDFPVNPGYNFVNMTVGGGAQSPFGPVDPVNSGLSGINDQTRVSIPPCTGAFLGSGDTLSGTAVNMTQFVWAPQHQALGGMIYGVDNIPRGAKVMSIMRTAPANRVIAQGLAGYAFADTVNGTTKSRFWLNLDIPDFKSGLVDQATQDDILANPQNYSLQFVSPLGVTSKVYGWAADNDFGSSNYLGKCADVLTYAGVQFDQGQVNVGEPTSGMAYQATGGSPAPLSNYVGYGAWRGGIPNPGFGPFHQTGSWDSDGGGNSIIAISDIIDVVNGRSSYLRVQVDPSIPGGFYQAPDELDESYDFDDSATREWHQPFYVVNIIRRDARVPDLTIDQYINTGYHVKIESCIGVSTGGSDTFRLLNERWEDVLSMDTTQYRYVWVQQGSAQPRAWFQISNSILAPQVQLILAVIAQNGFWVSPEGVQCYGVCVAGMETATSSSLRSTGCTISFGAFGTIPLPVPPANSRILVRYNKNAPIKFFGGDATIAPSAGCFIDGYTDYSSSTAPFDPVTGGTGVNGWLRLPHAGYRKNPQYTLPIKAGASPVYLSDYASSIYGLRQWCVMWEAEQRSGIRYHTATAAQGGPYSWPKVGYVIKPTVYDSNDPANGMYAYPTINVGGVDVSLTQDYARGGILFSDAVNPDYTRQPDVDGFGIPFDDQGGIAERTEFPTGLIASLEVDPLLTDAPGVRTFISQNLKVLSEESGEIKCIGSAVGSGGRNIYAWMDRAVSRVLTSKNILTGASGEQISTIVVSNFWGDEMVLSRQIGSPDQMWRLWAKGNAPTGQGYADSFFWPDRNSWYRLTGDTIMDIGRDKFLAESLAALRAFPDGYANNAVRASAAYDRKHNEALFSLFVPQPPSPSGQLSRPVRMVYSYSPQTGEWNGRYTYSFDSYAMHNGDLYGSRNKQAWELDSGSVISGSTRVASVTVPIVGDVGMYKEMIRWRVGGNVAKSKPDRIEILDPDFNVIVRKDAVINASPRWVKWYDGWEGWADRVLASVDPARPLPQNQYFFLRLIWNTDGEKSASAMSAQIKNIR